MALTDLTRISTAGIATGTSLSGAILHGDAHFRGTNAGINSAIFDSSENELNLKDNVKLTFGDAGTSDSQFYFDSNNLILQETSASGSMLLRGQNIRLQNASQANENYIECLGDNANRRVKIYQGTTTRFETTSTGAKVTGILTATSFSGPTLNTSGISTFYDLRVSNNLTVEGTTTTLDTNVTGVDRLEVNANSNSNTAIVGIQSGSADIVNLFSGTTEVLTILDTGEVGLGTISPGASLHIASTLPQIRLTDKDSGDIHHFISGSGSALILKADEGQDDGATATTIRFHIDTEEKMRIASDGKVGIGTVATKELHVDGTIFASAATPSLDGGLRISPNNAGSTNGGVIYGGAHNDSNHAIFVRRGYDGVQDTIDINEYGMFRVFTGGALASQDERLRITSTGKVGIGTNDPNGKTHIYESSAGSVTAATDANDLTLESSTNVGMSLLTANNSQARIKFGDPDETGAGVIVYNHQNDKFSIVTATGNRMIIGADMISARTDYGIARTAGGYTFRETNEGGERAGMHSNASNELIFKTAGAVEQLRINSTGQVGIATADPTAKLAIGRVTGGYMNMTGIKVNRPHSLGLQNGILVYTDNGYNATASYRAAAFKAVGTGGAAFAASTDQGSNGLGGTLKSRIGFDGGAFFLYRVGIGTDSPDQKLTVFDGDQPCLRSGATTFRVDQNATTWNNLTNNTGPILAWDFKSGPGDLMYMGSGGNTATADQMALVVSDSHGVKIGRSGYDGTDFDVSSTAEYFRITSTGNVGIASNAPAERLVVQGDVNSFLAYDKDGAGFDGTSGGALVLGAVFDYSGARLGLYASNDGSGRLMTKTSQSLYLGTNNTRRLSINNIGYVGIKTTNALAHLDIRGVNGSGSPTLAIHHSNADVEGEVIRIGRTDLNTIRYHSIKAKHSGSAASNYISFNLHDTSSTTSQSEVLKVKGDGNVAILDGNLSVANGHGIDFSATSGSGTSELLDDYEMGTYVPTWTTIASSPSTYRNGIDSGTTSNGLSYVRIGKQVTITGAAFWSGGSSINNTRPNMSLPFPARIYTVSGTVGHYSLGETEDVHYLNYNTTTSINFYRQSANSGHESFGDNSDGEMYFNITYMTTD